MGKYRNHDQLGHDAIEQWAKELEGAPKRDLTREESLAFITMGEAEKEEDSSGFRQMFDSLLGEWNGVALLHRRLSLHDYTMSKAAQITCGLMINTPGEMTMMANYIQYQCYKHRINHVDMKSLSKFIMPLGWFSQRVLSEFWDKQKYISPDRHLLNMLDNPEYGLSIRLKSIP